MNIGDVAARTGLPPKTIRYYEEIGLLKPPRGANGYRAFREGDMQRLVFLGRARALGFSIEDCRVLLDLRADGTRASAGVKDVSQGHLRRVEQKIADLSGMHETLSSLVRACAGGTRPDCPILDTLGTGAAQGRA
ncbi:MerR family transcriptional regulator [Oceanibium sediminis]|uniref:MerR family transcriptional regulator n=1 Tax=Oceanibium sediminis TaxID=2026339 RepID=UPI000DD4B40D|nr:MerR family transcriptional regulator [Oceanibium sediminis]